MAIRYSSDLRTERSQKVADFVDAGSGPGVLEICAAAYAAVLVSIALADPCGTVSGDVLTFDMPQSGVAIGSEAAAVARVKDSDGNVVADQITVGHTGGSEHVILSQATNDIVLGQTVTIDSFSITHNSGS